MVLALDINKDVNFAPAKFGNIATFINILLPFLIIGAALIFLAMGLYGGLTWVSSGGNEENLKKAQKIFTSSIIGLVIVLTSFFLIKLIGLILKINNILP